MVFRELSFSRLEYGVHDRLHIYPLCGIFYFPWHRHQIEGTNGFYCLIRKTERFTISNVESQVFTPNNSRLDPGSYPGCPRDKRMSYHWTNCALHVKTIVINQSVIFIIIQYIKINIIFLSHYAILVENVYRQHNDKSRRGYSYQLSFRHPE